MTTSSISSSSFTTISPPSGEYLIALFMRFATAWVTRVVSARTRTAYAAASNRTVCFSLRLSNWDTWVSIRSRRSTQCHVRDSLPDCSLVSSSKRSLSSTICSVGSCNSAVISLACSGRSVRAANNSLNPDRKVSGVRSSWAISEGHRLTTMGLLEPKERRRASISVTEANCSLGGRSYHCNPNDESVYGL